MLAWGERKSPLHAYRMNETDRWEGDGDERDREGGEIKGWGGVELCIHVL